MKKLNLLLLALMVSVAACKKDDPEPDPTPTPDPTPSLVTIGTPLSSFTKKVLIEEFTGAWCGYCPDGASRMEQILTNNPGKAIGTSIHDGDGMEISLMATLNSKFSVSGFPSGMVNRVPAPQDGDVAQNRGYWATNATSELAKDAKCGLAIAGKKLDGTTATVTVRAAFTEALTGTYNMTIYLVESNVTGTGSQYDQKNYMGVGCGATDPNSEWYNSPCTITGYKHMHVVRKVLTGNMGDAIPSTALVAGGTHDVTKTVDVGPYKLENLKVVAFVNKIGSTGTTHEVMNVQEASFYTGQLTGKNWD